MSRRIEDDDGTGPINTSPISGRASVTGRSRMTNSSEPRSTVSISPPGAANDGTGQVQRAHDKGDRPQGAQGGHQCTDQKNSRSSRNAELDKNSDALIACCRVIEAQKQDQHAGDPHPDTGRRRQPKQTKHAIGDEQQNRMPSQCSRAGRLSGLPHGLAWRTSVVG